MPPHANFAAVLGISQQVMRDLIRMAYQADSVPHSFQADQEVAGLMQLSADLFSDAPEISLSAAEERSFLIRINAWGPMTIALPQLQGGNLVLVPEERLVKFIADLVVPHAIAVEEGEMVIGIDASRTTLVSKSITVMSGGEYSAGVRNLLASQVFHNLLQDAIRDNLADLGDGFPPMDIAFLEPLLGPILGDDDEVNGPEVELVTTARSVDGALIVGIDVIREGFGTVGNPNELTDVTRNLGMATWANPDLWLTNMREQLLAGTETTQGIQEQVEAQGAKLDKDSFKLDLREGLLHVSGRATKDDFGAARFSFDVVPHLVRPGIYRDLGYDEFGNHYVIRTEAREELWFEITNVQVDIDRPWWAWLLEVIFSWVTFGIAALVIEAFVSMIRNNIVAEIASSETVRENRVHRFRPIDGGPEVTSKIEAFEFHEDGVFMGLSFTPDYPVARIICTSHCNASVIDINDALRGDPIEYRVRLPHVVHLEDPYLRVRWTARKLDDNSLLCNVDDLARGNTALVISDFQNATRLLVSCRVYRTLGAQITDFFNDSLSVWFSDSLDRTRPYVRWYHYAYTPDVRIEPDGSRTILGGHVKYRVSQIHRTDFPGRCRMASRYSLAKPRGFRPPSGRPPRLEYMDALPFPVSSLNAHRHEVCEYCFFGSPQSTQPLPLPA